MFDVILALVPALAVSTYVMGWRVLFITAVAVAGCLVFEYLISRFLLKRGSTIGDLSAIVTGMLLAFNLPVGIPWWIVLVGSLVAIGIGKMTFGGLGCNPFNPALTGRIFLLIAYPVQMTDWTTNIPDAISGSTLLANIKGSTYDAAGNIVLGNMNLDGINFMSMLGGNMNGSLGEVASLALIIGGLYLLWRRVISWHIPVAVLEGNVVKVAVGSVEHPMAEEHSILWVELKTDKGVQRKNLVVGEPPVVSFALVDEKPLEVYAYCNLHGLWKTEL